MQLNRHYTYAYNVCIQPKVFFWKLSATSYRQLSYLFELFIKSPLVASRKKTSKFKFNWQ